MDKIGVGEFWLPELSGSKKITGSLEHSTEPGPAIWQLITHERLDGTKPTIFNLTQGIRRFTVVFGHIKGFAVTLLDCRYSGTSLQKNYSETRYTPKFVIFGGHYDDIEVNCPSYVEFSIANLSPFLRTVASSPGSQPASWEKVFNYWLQHDSPTYEWRLDGYSVNLSINVDVSRNGPSTTLREIGVFAVTKNSAQRLADWFTDVILPILELIRFASSHMTNLETVRIRPNSDQEPDLKPNLIDVYINSEVQPVNSPVISQSTDWFLNANDLSEEILRRFLDRTQVFQDLMSKLVKVEASPIDDDEKLIQLVRLLESFHRLQSPVSTADVEAYQKQVDEIIDIVAKYQPEHIQLLSRQLRFGYEPSLERRLIKLVEPWKDDLQTIFGSSKRVNRLIGSIAQHRNYLAHGLSKESPPLIGIDLVSATTLLSVLGRLLVLNAAGISPADCWTMIQRLEVGRAHV